MKKLIRSLALFVAAISLMTTLVACGTKLKGTYTAEDNLMGYTFESGGKGTMTIAGVETPMVYSIEDDKLTINGVPYTFEFEDDTLKITDLSGKTVEYTKE